MTACIYFLITFYVAHSVVLFWFQLLVFLCGGTEGAWSGLCDTSSAKWESKKLEDSALWFWGFILLVSQAVIEGKKNHKAIYIFIEFCLHGSDFMGLTWVCKLWTFKLLFWRESLGYLYFFNHFFALSTNSMNLLFN